MGGGGGACGSVEIVVVYCQKKKHQILISVNFVLTTGMNKKLLIHRGLSKAIDEGAYK